MIWGIIIFNMFLMTYYGGECHKDHDDYAVWEPDGKRLIADDKRDIEARLEYLEKRHSWTSTVHQDMELRITNYDRKAAINDNVECVQLIEVRVLDDGWRTRDWILANCHGKTNIRVHRAYQLSYGHFLHIYGFYRIIYRDKENGCKEKYYNVWGNPKMQFLDDDDCREKIRRIHSWEGTVRKQFFKVFHYPTGK